jgi:hypothetical protein
MIQMPLDKVETDYASVAPVICDRERIYQTCLAQMPDLLLLLLMIGLQRRTNADLYIHYLPSDRSQGKGSTWNVVDMISKFRWCYAGDPMAAKLLSACLETEDKERPCKVWMDQKRKNNGGAKDQLICTYYLID